ncbi:hypothetical protein [Kocuria palustris]|uniref:hypothetical protein n=1 Tax=Kocuria palustris TaxID=71999 RepID=UPI0024683188|nr:hypothetical protein [Kocuria palustris]MDH5152729.1 hypothetical protein [Kocuria palustris]
MGHTLAGPEQIRLPDLARTLLDADNDDRQTVTVPLPLLAVRDGMLLAPEGAEL